MYFLLVLLYNISVYHDIHECIEVRRDYKMPCYNCKSSWKLSTTLRYKYRFIWPYPLTIGGILSAALHIQLKKVSQVLLSDLSENFQLVTTGFVITIRILHALWLLFEQCRITNS